MGESLRRCLGLGTVVAGVCSSMITANAQWDYGIPVTSYQTSAFYGTTSYGPYYQPTTIQPTTIYPSTSYAVPATTLTTQAYATSRYSAYGPGQSDPIFNGPIFGGPTLYSGWTNPAAYYGATSPYQGGLVGGGGYGYGSPMNLRGRLRYDVMSPYGKLNITERYRRNGTVRYDVDD